jgi:hypothetical protein
MVPLWRRPTVWSVALVALLVGGALGWYFFAPKGARHLDEPLPGDPAAYRALAAGEWRGADAFHHASGALRLLEGEDGGRLLRFEGYDARDGPAVYFYLVKEAGNATEESVEEQGVRLAAANVRGTFNLVVPAGVDPAAYDAVVAWCDTFDVLFGVAALERTA